MKIFFLLNNMSTCLTQEAMTSAVEKIIDYLKQSGYNFDIDAVNLSDARKKISDIFMTTHPPNTYAYIKLITTISKCLDNLYAQTTISKLKDAITRLREETLPALKSKYEDEIIPAIKSEFQNEVDILNNTINNFKEEIKRLEEENKSLKDEIERISTTSYKELKRTIDSLQAENEFLEGQLEHYSEICPTYP